MTLNVHNKDGEHVGFIYCYDYYSKCFKVAISNYILDEYKFDYEKMRKNIAQYYEYVTWMGKIKDSFEDFLKDKKRELFHKGEEYFDEFAVNNNYFLRSLYLRMLHGKEDSLFDTYNENFERTIQGFIFYKPASLVATNNSLLLDEELDYIQTGILNGEKPIYGKVSGVPIVNTRTGILDHRVYNQETIINVKTGNVMKKLELSMYLACKEGMPIQYLPDKSKIYCDGVLYQNI